MTFPSGKFGVVYADPPWSFKTWTTGGLTHRAAEHHYQTQGIDWLKALPVQDLAAPDCALFMWAVDSHVGQAIELMKSWGFEYKTRAFVWVKTCKDDHTRPRMGLGYWTRKESEVCLLGTKGSPKRRDKGVRQVIMEPRREHSRKPAETRHRIKRLVNGPYIELFAREETPGWTSWGNETDLHSVTLT